MILQNVDYGKSVFVKENGEYVEYVLISKDSYSCELLRVNAVVAKRMNATNTTDYTGCEMDQYLSSEETSGFLSRFDADTKAALVMRSISTFSYGDTECHYISRKCYLPSYGQCFLGSTTALYPEKTIVPELMIWKGTLNGDSARVAKDNVGASAIGWWLRSPYSATRYWRGNLEGRAADDYAFNPGFWCRPVLNLSSTTPVEESQGSFYLLPSETPRAVEFKYLLNKMSTNPKKAIVSFTAHNLNNVFVKVCNNYGDTNPIWVDITDGTEKTFENESKQTENWQIGIWCYGDTTSYSPAYFEEPTVLLEV